MTYVIWSNAGKHEWIVSEGEEIVQRSGLIFNSRSAAKTNMNKTMGTK
jgi:hypothetical protein